MCQLDCLVSIGDTVGVVGQCYLHNGVSAVVRLTSCHLTLCVQDWLLPSVVWEELVTVYYCAWEELVIACSYVLSCLLSII